MPRAKLTDRALKSYKPAEKPVARAAKPRKAATPPKPAKPKSRADTLPFQRSKALPGLTTD